MVAQIKTTLKSERPWKFSSMLLVDLICIINVVLINKWMNECCLCSCRLFLHSVVSALLGVALVLLVSSYVLVEFFVEPSRLRTDQHFLCKWPWVLALLTSANSKFKFIVEGWNCMCVSVFLCAQAVRNDSSVWYIFLPVAPLRSAAAVIPGLAVVTITLALLSSVLLSHLLCFHIYLSKTLACLSLSVRRFYGSVFNNYFWIVSAFLFVHVGSVEQAQYLWIYCASAPSSRQQRLQETSSSSRGGNSVGWTLEGGWAARLSEWTGLSPPLSLCFWSL